MVPDVVSPLLLAATSMAVAVALYKILTLYDFYRTDPAFPGAKVLIFFGLAFFLPQGLASMTALGWRDFWCLTSGLGLCREECLPRRSD
jgi:hypothetical protein